MVPFDIEHYQKHIKFQAQTHDQVAKELGRLSKFYKHEKGAVHQEPMVVMDFHGRILLWYLPEVLSTADWWSSQLMNLTWSNHLTNHMPGQIQTGVDNHGKLPLTRAGNQVFGTMKASDSPRSWKSLGQESEHSIPVGLCRVIR